MKNFITVLALGMLFCTASMVNTASATSLYGAMGAGYDDNAPVKSKNSKTKISKKKQKTPTNIFVASGMLANDVGKVIVNTASRFNAGAKPGRWCGWWLRTQLGGGPEYNLARNWAKRGSPASGPQVGVVVVWRGHVGIITGKAADGRWIVKSGNDGNAVRERARSLKHRTGMPIAYRHV